MAKRVALQIQHVLLVLRIFVPIAVKRDIGKKRASKLGVAKKVALQIETGPTVFSMRRLQLILLYLFTIITLKTPRAAHGEDNSCQGSEGVQSPILYR